MRLLGSFEDPKQALAFAHFLGKMEIPHQIEFVNNTDWGSTSYGNRHCDIWVQEEDDFSKAMTWFQEFKRNPRDPQFVYSDIRENPPIPPEKKYVGWNKRPLGWLTRGILLICTLLFFSNQLYIPPEDAPAHIPFVLFSSPVEKGLLYDYPEAYTILNTLVQKYGYKNLLEPNKLPPEGRALYKKLVQTPYWQGFYALLQEKEKDASEAAPPLFEKIRQGELWRLFTPALLHGSLLHIFLNMLWLIVLGKQIEQHLGPWRYIVFILGTGIFSNTAQYLMSGPNFIGFSGVLCAMLTFILARQRYAPQESYQLEKATILFMLIFIVGMAFIQLLSFFLEAAANVSIPTGVANTAHLAGALIGYLFGRIQYFSERSSS